MGPGSAHFALSRSRPQNQELTAKIPCDTILSEREVSMRVLVMKSDRSIFSPKEISHVESIMAYKASEILRHAEIEELKTYGFVICVKFDLTKSNSSQIELRVQEFWEQIHENLIEGSTPRKNGTRLIEPYPWETYLDVIDGNSAFVPVHDNYFVLRGKVYDLNELSKADPISDRVFVVGNEIYRIDAFLTVAKPVDLPTVEIDEDTKQIHVGEITLKYKININGTVALFNLETMDFVKETFLNLAEVKKEIHKYI